MPVSRLDVIYRKLLLTKFFTKGWGEPKNLERLFKFRKVISDRNKCYNLVPKCYPITLINSEKYEDCVIIEGRFLTPFAAYQPELVPSEVEQAFFQVILPVKWKNEFKPMCIHLAGTGDHYFWRRRNMMAKPLLKAGIGSIILENPFYGVRKPKDQIRSSVHYVSDIFVMGGCLILECLVLLNWCEQRGFGPLGITGISMGGHMASLAASNWPKPVVLVPCLSWSTASSVFTEGVMSESIDWKLLQAQYINEKLYSEKLSKECKIVDDPFASNLSKDYKFRCGMMNNNNNNMAKEINATNITPHELVNIFKRIKAELEDHHPTDDDDDDDDGSLKIKNLLIEDISIFTPPTKHVIKMGKTASEAIWFMRGMMDECTHLKNFTVPVDTNLVISINAKIDGYVPRGSVSKLDDIWPGVTVRYLNCGHVGAYIFYRNVFIDAIIEAFERAKKTTKKPFSQNYHEL